MQLLSKFWKTSRIGMLKTVIKVRIRSAVVFYEEIVAVSKFKKFLNWQRNGQKPKNFNLSMFLCSFRQIYDRRRGLER